MANDTRYEGMYDDPMQRQVSDTAREAQCRQKRRELDARVQTLCAKAIEYEDKFGKDNFRTMILVTTLEVVLQMKDAIDLLSDVGIALQCIGQAIGCVDEAFKLQQDVLDSTLNTKYGFMARMKTRRKIKKAMRNNVNRMKQMVDMVVGVQSIGFSLIESLRKMGVRMKKLANKGFAKGTKGMAAGGESGFGNAERLMAEVRAGSSDGSTGGSGSGSGSGSTGAGSTGSGSGGSSRPSGGSGVPDIGDIV